MGLVCVAGVCEKVPPAGMCWADADCGEGGKCVGAITCPCGAMCFAASQPGKCDYGQPSACYANDDCAAGETCEITNDCCAPEGCLPGMICPAVCVPCGQCVQSLPTQCFADSECPAGFICEVTAECPPCTYMDPPCMMPCKAVGKCVPSGGCLSDADCDDGDPCTGDYCHNGACENVAKSSCCQKIDPFAYGMCEMFMGFGFDGTKCVGVSGCGCGADCGKIYKTLDECKKACAA
jgi:Cys-rich repeat protein